MMDPNSPPREASMQADSHPPEKEIGLLDDARLLWHELAELRHVSFRLFALEAQRAGLSLVAMIIAGVLIAILLSVVWLGLVAAAMLTLKYYDLVTDEIKLILLAVLINALMVLILMIVIRSKSYYLRFPATVRSLQPKQEQLSNREKP
ncbi:phage holin family protein [Nitrosomonas sp. JL21]|uniref:phage holin family protein n=1 Tax=Nitrosomonas sp. JL21 TaxID=153949 RepID=UPI0013698814|nr:phage holin family protein [Nitrosomonas sp. JL21]MBL8496843.1 hypothetical protein [Nitrosomonas sp.]MBL8498405.1 hypothetical protein [Nitrosomonas sp.]MCC7090833.1 hypothetical protein [Nitrosomonas sp.]MXS77617.1 phage holin family protein [Nitrosomonas sp. JL21]